MTTEKISFAGVTTKPTTTGRIRRPAFLKMLRSGLVTVRSSGCTSDDDVSDASNGHARGNAADPVAVALDIEANPGGWWGALEDGRMVLDCGYRGYYVTITGTPCIAETPAITRVEAMQAEQARRDARPARRYQPNEYAVTATATTITIDGKDRPIFDTYSNEAMGCRAAGDHLPGGYAHNDYHSLSRQIWAALNDRKTADELEVSRIEAWIA